MSKNSVVVGDGITVTRAQLKRAQKQYARRKGGLPGFWQTALDLMGPEPERVKKTRSAKPRRKPVDTGFSEGYLAQHKAEIGLSSKDRRRERRAASKRSRHRDE